MTMFGLKEAEVAGLVRAVSGDAELSRDDLEQRFARATWTGIAEPGDSTAGVAVEALGPARALIAVLERWSAQRLVEECEAHGIPLTHEQATGALERWMPRLNSGAAVVALRQAARYGVQLMIPGDELWPRGVDDLQEHAPLALWLRGTEEACRSLDRSIALVGARAATGYGEHVTMEAAAGLVDRGYAIVSGAAYGIDGMAHRAALASHGHTIAFLAGGVDRFYPSGHDALLARIVERGAVISELPCGSSPTRWRFLQRNRLIAAASLATVVLEAGWRSGSLNTANHAGTLGRPLGAVPGPVTSAASAGCHRLIREVNAICVTNADEMAELAPMPEAHVAAAPLELPVESLGREPAGAPATGGTPMSATATRAAPTSPPTTNTATRVRDALSTRAHRTVADIASRAGLSVTDVAAQLGRLELEGVVRERDAGWVRATTPTASRPAEGNQVADSGGGSP